MYGVAVTHRHEVWGNVVTVCEDLAVEVGIDRFVCDADGL